MGTYLSVPNKEKTSEYGSSDKMKFAVSEMQGWRKNMEDAHIALTQLDNPEHALFAVFDGHGGKEVALFCRKHFAEELQQLESYKAGKYGDSLQEAFHQMDTMLREPRYTNDLLRYQQMESAADLDDDEDEDEDMDHDSSDNGKASMEACVKAQIDAAEAKGTLTKDEAMELMLKMFKLKKMSQNQNSYVCEAGCTAVVVLVCGKKMYIANAGDSRAIISRGGDAIALSEDHKPSNPEEYERITNAGGFVTDVGRVNGNLNLSRSIGDLRYKTDNNIGPEKQIITAHPDIVEHELSDDDEFFVLACDGVWDVKSNQDVVDFFSPKIETSEPLTQPVEDLLDDCITESPVMSEGLGADNMTCIVVKLL